MRTKKYIGILLCMLTFVIACDNESLEDTYKEYAGKGEIRYLGKCNNLLVTPGWKRIIITWENNSDPCIEKIKVKWVLDEAKDSVLVNRGTTQYDIKQLNGEELNDGNYEISVSSVDVDGKTSIPATVYGRPYTYAHEDIRAFNRIISQVYIIRNHLILSFLGWQDNMRSASLEYTKKDGSSGTLELNKELVNQHYYLLPDEIDASKPLTLYRNGELIGCQDIIDFEPYVFSTVRTFEADFKQELKRQFGFDEISSEWIDHQETLYLDWNLSSFIDLLNFPNLKKIVLGSKRYFTSPNAADDMIYGQSKVAEKDASNFALNVLKELNGLTVERYNKHFQGLDNNLIEEKGATEVPVKNMINLSNAEVSMYPADDENIPSRLENLIDGDFNTNWNPMYTTSYLIYELTLDLKEGKKINGLRFVQANYNDNEDAISMAPEMIKIYVSNDRVSWKIATYLEESIIGKTKGEINDIDFTNEIKNNSYQYVQVRINAGPFGKYFGSRVAEINLY